MKKNKNMTLLLSFVLVLNVLSAFAGVQVQAKGVTKQGGEDSTSPEESGKAPLFYQIAKYSNEDRFYISNPDFNSNKSITIEAGKTIREHLGKHSDILKESNKSYDGTAEEIKGIRVYSNNTYQELRTDKEPDADNTYSFVYPDQYVVRFYLMNSVSLGGRPVLSDGKDNGVSNSKDESWNVPRDGRIPDKVAPKTVQLVRKGEPLTTHLPSALQSLIWFTVDENGEFVPFDSRTNPITKDTCVYAYERFNSNGAFGDYFIDPNTGLLVKLLDKNLNPDELRLMIQQASTNPEGSPKRYKLLNGDKEEIKPSRQFNFFFSYKDDDDQTPVEIEGGVEVWLPINSSLRSKQSDYEVVSIDEAANKVTLFTSSDSIPTSYQSSDPNSTASKYYKCITIMDQDTKSHFAYLVAKTYGRGNECTLADPASMVDAKAPTTGGSHLTGTEATNLAKFSNIYQVKDGKYVVETQPSGIKFYFDKGTFSKNPDQEMQVQGAIYALQYAIASPAGYIRNVAFNLAFMIDGNFVEPMKPVTVEVPYEGLNASKLDILRKTGPNSYATVSAVVSPSVVRFEAGNSAQYIFAETVGLSKTNLKLVAGGTTPPITAGANSPAPGTNPAATVPGNMNLPVAGEADYAIHAAVIFASALGLYLLKRKMR